MFCLRYRHCLSADGVRDASLTRLTDQQKQDLLFSAPLGPISAPGPTSERFRSADLQESKAPPPLLNAFITECRSTSARGLVPELC